MKLFSIYLFHLFRVSFLSFPSQLDILIHGGRFIGFSLRFSFMKEQIQMFEVEEQMKNFVYSCILAFFSSSSC